MNEQPSPAGYRCIESKLGPFYHQTPSGIIQASPRVSHAAEPMAIPLRAATSSLQRHHSDFSGKSLIRSVKSYLAASAQLVLAASTQSFAVPNSSNYHELFDQPAVDFHRGSLAQQLNQYRWQHDNYFA